MGDGVHRAVDGDPLVVARRIGVLAGEIGLFENPLLFGRDAFAAVAAVLVAGDELLFRRKFVHAEFAFLSREEIMLHEAVAVGAVGEREIEHRRVFHGLLQAGGHAVAVVLRLDDRDGIVRAQIQKIIDAFRLLTEGEIAFQIDPAVRDLRLHRKLLDIPFGGDGGSDILRFDVFFGHLLFIQDHCHQHILLFRVMFQPFTVSTQDWKVIPITKKSS